MEERENAIELLRLWTKAIKEKDFKTFAAFCKIYSESKGSFMTLKYMDWTDAQKSFEKNRCGKDIVLKPRRIGFTTLELARDLFFALVNEGTRTVIVTQEERLGQDSISIIKDMIEGIEELNAKICKILNTDFTMIEKKHKGTWNTSELEFANGSRIQYLVAKNQEKSADRTGRGIGISRLHATEVAFWLYPDLAMKSLLNAANNAKEIVVESTANGAFGWFYDFFLGVIQRQKPEWKHHFFPWFEHADYKKKLNSEDKEDIEDFMRPRNEYETKLILEIGISKEQLNWYRNKVAESNINDVLQEYPIDIATCFRTKGANFLDEQDYAYLDSCVRNPDREEVTDFDQAPIFIYQEPLPRKRYIIGADIGYGREQDYSAFCVIDDIFGNIVATFASNQISPTKFARLLHFVAERYNRALIVPEAQAAGISTIQELIEHCRYYNVFREINKDYYGFNTTGQTRVLMFNLLQTIVKEKKIPIIDDKTIEQTRNLVIKNNRVDHTRNGHDDRVIAYLLAQKARLDSGAGLENLKIESVRKLNIPIQRMGKSPFGFSRN